MIAKGYKIYKTDQAVHLKKTKDIKTTDDGRIDDLRKYAVGL